MNLINKNFVRDLCEVRKCPVDPFMHGNWAVDYEPFYPSRLRKNSVYSPSTTIDDNDYVFNGQAISTGTQHTLLNADRSPWYHWTDQATAGLVTQDPANTGTPKRIATQNPYAEWHTTFVNNGSQPAHDLGVFNGSNRELYST